MFKATISVEIKNFNKRFHFSSDKLSQYNMGNYQKSSKRCLNAYCSPFLPHNLMIKCNIMYLLWGRRRILGIKVCMAIVISNRSSNIIFKFVWRFAIIKFVWMLSLMVKLANLQIIEKFKITQCDGNNSYLTKGDCIIFGGGGIRKKHRRANAPSQGKLLWPQAISQNWNVKHT